MIARLYASAGSGSVTTGLGFIDLDPYQLSAAAHDEAHAMGMCGCLVREMGQRSTPLPDPGDAAAPEPAPDRAPAAHDAPPADDALAGAALPALTPVAIDFSGGLDTYNAWQDRNPDTVTPSSDGTAVTISGDAWKKIDLPQTVVAEAGSVLRLTIEIPAGSEARFHAVGLDADGNQSNGNEALFQVAGLSRWHSVQNGPQVEPGSGPVTIEIPLDAYAGQSFDRLVLINEMWDADGGTPRMTVSDVSIGDAGALPATPPPPPPPPPGDVLDFSGGLDTYNAWQDRNPDTVTPSSDGTAVTISGDAWKKIDLPQTVVAEAGSVLRLTIEIPAGSEARFHAVGLDADGNQSNGNEALFQVAGLSRWHSVQNGPQVEPGSGPVTIEIPLDAYAGQSFDRLVLINEMWDADGGTPRMTVSDVSIGDAGALPATPPPPPPPPANTAPVIDQIAPVTVSEDDAPVMIDLLASASDADGDALALGDVTVRTAEGQTVAFTQSGGRIIIDPDQFGADLDAGQSATVLIDYEVLDGQGGVAAGTATLTVEGEDEAQAPGLMDSYVSGAPGAYNVEVVFTGTWTSELQAAFVDAADWVSSIIVGDVPDAVRQGVLIDDIQISAELAAIDGPGNVLGQAGPTVIRAGSYLPMQGIMRFDEADAQTYLSNGRWTDIIFHEMMHAIGFGTIWDIKDLLDRSNGEARFIGENAIAAYAQSYPNVAAADARADLGVPVETDFGPGSAFSHWDEALFGAEVMTPRIGGESPLSDMTIASLEDLGYDTVWEMPLV